MNVNDITVMQMYLIELFFREKRNVFRNFFDLLGNGCLRCAKLKGFFVSNSFVVPGHVTCKKGHPSRSRVGYSSLKFVAIISFQLSLSKLEQRLSSN